MTRLFLIGGGASLRGFDFTGLRNERVWAINTAFLDCPWAELVYWTDPWVYERNQAAFDAFPGRKVLGLDRTRKPRLEFERSDIERLYFSGLEGFDERPGHCRHGNNSGYALLHKAIQANEPRIYLLGYDMRADEKRSNYHNRNQRVIRDEVFARQMCRYFPGLVEPARARGVEIMNLSPQTRLTLWPVGSFADLVGLV